MLWHAGHADLICIGRWFLVSSLNIAPSEHVEASLACMHLSSGLLGSHAARQDGTCAQCLQTKQTPCAGNLLNHLWADLCPCALSHKPSSLCPGSIDWYQLFGILSQANPDFPKRILLNAPLVSRDSDLGLLAPALFTSPGLLPAVPLSPRQHVRVQQSCCMPVMDLPGHQTPPQLSAGVHAPSLGPA